MKFFSCFQRYERIILLRRKSLPERLRLFTAIHNNRPIAYGGPHLKFRGGASLTLATALPLGISDRNKMVLWQGCGGCTEFSLHTKNVRSVWFVVKRRGCCCKPLRWCCVDCMIHHERDVRYEQKYIYVARTSNNRVIYCCLLPRCEALRTCRSGFPIATVYCDLV